MESSKRLSVHFFLLVFSLLLTVIPTDALKVSGKVNFNGNRGKLKPDWKNAVEYVGKFGVQKGGAPLYVYGPVTNATSSQTKVILVVAPSKNWTHITKEASKDMCTQSNILPGCSLGGGLHYRVVPCEGKSCRGNLDPNNKIPPNDVYFNVNPSKTGFYYIYFVFCSPKVSNEQCNSWTPTNSTMLDYSITVSRNPSKHHNPFYFQFPANLDGILVAYLVFSLLYAVLIPVHIVFNFRRCSSRNRCQNYALVWIFTASIIMESTNVLLGLFHYSAYSSNGKGVPVFFYMKDFLNLVGDWFIFTVLILIASGWQVTVKFIKWKYASFIVWSIYVLFSLIYYIYEVVYLETEPWKLNDPLQTWAGGLYLAVRGLVLFYVWYQIYDIHSQEEETPKLRLYKTMFIMFSIWFWYLPFLVFIVTFTGHVSASLVIAIISTTMNFLANLVMVTLFCPRLSNQYFQFEDDMGQYPTLLKQNRFPSQDRIM